MKVAVVGAGSTYTPELVEGFARRGDRLPMDELAMLDIAPGRLEIVGGLASRMLTKVGWEGTLTLTADRDEALEGADFVVVQLRVGGNQARLVDETIPLEFGCIGQETTGPGGFAKGLRTVPVVLELAELAARRGAPGAWFVDFTNPTGLVTQALLDRGHRALGLCNVAIGFQRRFASLFAVEPERVQLEHVGLNHLTWERKVFVDGVDRLPEILADGIDDLSDETDMPTELIRAIGAIPSYYLHYYYLTDRVRAEQSVGRPRAQEVMEIEARLLELYRDPALDTKPKLLEERGGAFYSEAAAALVASLHAGTGDVQVVNVRNDGAIANLPDDAVVEIPARIDREGAHPLPLEPLAPDMLGLVEHVKAYELLTIDAATGGDRQLALRALMTNPLVGDYDIAAPLLEALLDVNRGYLPAFFPSDSIPVDQP
ncbi:MAG: 6-phospho-beta-glucosidase [Chloroflexota bacterium]|nr:6-phospho-beta-glucosidase [Chloroflexota bacterium]